jgi:hypothetical protein
MILLAFTSLVVDMLFTRTVETVTFLLSCKDTIAELSLRECRLWTQTWGSFFAQFAGGLQIQFFRFYQATQD